MNTSRVIVVHGHRDNAHWPGISYECEKRVKYAQSIIRPGDTVILSGSGKEGWDSEARQMNSFRFWPSENEIEIILEEESSTTKENVEKTLPIALEKNPNEIIVVSSWWHLRIPIYWIACPVRFRFARAPGDSKYLQEEIKSWRKAASPAIHLPQNRS